MKAILPAIFKSLGHRLKLHLSPLIFLVTAVQSLIIFVVVAVVVVQPQVGIASVQIAKAMGLRVVGTAGTKEGMDLVLKAGADLVFNHREDGYVKAIQVMHWA